MNARKKSNKSILSRMVSLSRPTALAMAVAALGGMTSSVASASQFGVRVVDDAGNPVSGASVCIGLPGNYKQFGALFTDADGRAVTEVPNVPLVVTVSKTRFSGTRLSEPARGFNLIREVTLSEGRPGPRCRAGSSMAGNESSVRIAHVDIMEQANRVRLSPQVSGDPSHYRVGTTADFDSSQWVLFEDTIALSSAMAAEGEVLLQMRRLEGTSNGWIEAVSRVVSVNLPAMR